jgi:hypothetical protein
MNSKKKHEQLNIFCLFMQVMFFIELMNSKNFLHMKQRSL